MMKNGRVAAAIFTAIGQLCIASVRGQANEPSEGAGVIGTLTAETREQAIDCGRRGPECAVVPYQLCPDNGRFSVVLLTPFSRVAVAAARAAKEGRPLGRMGPASVNRWGVSIQVAPAPDAKRPDSIDRLELRREGQVIRPIKSTVGPLTVIAGDGTPARATRGVFYLPAAALEPSSAVQVIMTGPSGETRCTLGRAQLTAVR